MIIMIKINLINKLYLFYTIAWYLEKLAILTSDWPILSNGSFSLVSSTIKIINGGILSLYWPSLSKLSILCILNTEHFYSFQKKAI